MVEVSGHVVGPKNEIAKIVDRVPLIDHGPIQLLGLAFRLIKLISQFDEIRGFVGLQIIADDIQEVAGSLVAVNRGIEHPLD